MTLSIAIATYNGDRFLREQLDSLYRQTRLPDEVVVSDDGSTDRTLEILEEYHQRYGLKYSVNTGKHGVNENFFRAISLCTGDLIQICDQDDIWMSKKIEVLADEMEKMDATKPAVVSSLRYDIDAEGKVIGGAQYERNEGWRGTLLTYGRNQGCTMMMNRKMVKEVLRLYDTHPKEVLSMYYDEVIAYAAVIIGQKVNLPNQLMYYRHHDRNVVDPYKGRLTFREKVRTVPVFWGVTLDERWRPMSTIHSLLRDQINDEELEVFLNMVDRVVAEKNRWRQLKLILQCPVLTRRKRIEAGIKGSISITLKKCLGEGCEEYV